MSKKIQRVLAVIFDIENYSTTNPKKQLFMVGTFIKILIKSLSEIKKLKPDVFSTGDGAIISIGRQCSIGESQIKDLLNF